MSIKEGIFLSNKDVFLHIILWYFSRQNEFQINCCLLLSDRAYVKGHERTKLSVNS